VNGVCAGSRVTASFPFSRQWATGYCGELTVRNVSTTLVNDWHVDVDPRESGLVSNWNSIFHEPRRLALRRHAGGLEPPGHAGQRDRRRLLRGQARVGLHAARSRCERELTR
jgi:hypothetical protein